MRYTQCNTGRTFVIRLDDGDVLHESVEGFCKDHGITAAYTVVLGGADEGSKLIVGPKEGRAPKIEPLETVLSDVYEIGGVGTVISNKAGEPILHMHISCGRNDNTITGCVRRGVKVWHVMELVLVELTDCSAKRILEKEVGFELLNP